MNRYLGLDAPRPRFRVRRDAEADTHLDDLIRRALFAGRFDIQHDDL
jgi:hypothetical protein